jgi:hypothetical protein
VTWPLAKVSGSALSQLSFEDHGVALTPSSKGPASPFDVSTSSVFFPAGRKPSWVTVSPSPAPSEHCTSVMSAQAPALGLRESVSPGERGLPVKVTFEKPGSVYSKARLAVKPKKSELHASTTWRPATVVELMKPCPAASSASTSGALQLRPGSTLPSARQTPERHTCPAPHGTCALQDAGASHWPVSALHVCPGAQPALHSATGSGPGTVGPHPDMDRGANTSAASHSRARGNRRAFQEFMRSGQYLKTSPLRLGGLAPTCAYRGQDGRSHPARAAR